MDAPDDDLQKLPRRGARRRFGDGDDAQRARDAEELRRRLSASWLGLGGTLAGTLWTGILSVAVVGAVLFATLERSAPTGPRRYDRESWEVLILLSCLLPAALLFGLLRKALSMYLRAALEEKRHWLRQLPFPVTGFEELLANREAPDFTIVVEFARPPRDAARLLLAASAIAGARNPAPSHDGSVLRLPQQIRRPDATGGHYDHATANLSRRRFQQVTRQLLLPLHREEPIRQVALS